MNSDDPKHPWSRLVAAARTAPEMRDATPPYGFATRVVARAFTQPPAAVSLFERFSLRALGFACLLALASAVANYRTVAGVITAEESLASDDLVAELVELAI